MWFVYTIIRRSWSRLVCSLYRVTREYKFSSRAGVICSGCTVRDNEIGKSAGGGGNNNNNNISYTRVLGEIIIKRFYMCSACGGVVVAKQPVRYNNYVHNG
uniref:Uncharacterized protein n=1 Tax=Schizaphis graminum TaxID=13262 RepID=A0A2S2N9U0_SCHGA